MFWKDASCPARRRRSDGSLPDGARSRARTLSKHREGVGTNESTNGVGTGAGHGAGGRGGRAAVRVPGEGTVAGETEVRRGRLLFLGVQQTGFDPAKPQPAAPAAQPPTTATGSTRVPACGVRHAAPSSARSSVVMPGPGRLRVPQSRAARAAGRMRRPVSRRNSSSSRHAATAAAFAKARAACLEAAATRSSEAGSRCDWSRKVWRRIGPEVRCGRTCVRREAWSAGPCDDRSRARVGGGRGACVTVWPGTCRQRQRAGRRSRAGGPSQSRGLACQ